MRWLPAVALLALAVVGAGWLLGEEPAPPSGPAAAVDTALAEDPASSSPQLEGRAAAASLRPAFEAPPPRSRIRGYVVDDRGKRVSELFVRQSSNRMRYACDGRGAFEILDPGPGTRVLQATTKAGSEVGEPVRVEFKADTPVDGVRIVVPHRRVLGGVVVGSEGQPAPGLMLEFEHVDVATDAEGRFKTHAWGPGPFRARSGDTELEGEATGGRTDARLVYGGSDGELLVRLEGPDGAPVEHGQVSIGPAAWRHAGQTQIAVGGIARFRRSRLRHFKRPAALVVRHVAAGFGPVRLEAVDIDQPELVVRLPIGRILRGRVVDERGGAVGGLRIHARRTEDRYSELARTNSDARGRFALGGLPREPVLVSVFTQGTAWAPLPPVRVADDGLLVLRVHRGAVCEVVVRDPDGKPVRGALVNLSAQDAPYGWQALETDAQGRVHAEGLPPGVRMTAYVRMNDAALPRAFVLREVQPDGGRLVVDVPRAAEIRGTLVDESGKPWWDARVTAAGSDDTTWGTGGTVAPERRTGAFVFRGLVPGRYDVSINKTSRRPPSRGVSVHAPARDVRIVAPDALTVSGRVVADRPEGWRVTWFMEERLPGRNNPRALTDEEGRFEIRNVRNERTALLVRRAEDNHVALLEGVGPGDGPFELRPVEGKTIRGRIDGLRGRESVWASLRRGLVSIAVGVRRDGRFEIPAVPAGDWQLVVGRMGDAKGVSTPVAAGDEGVVVDLPR